MNKFLKILSSSVVIVTAFSTYSAYASYTNFEKSNTQTPNTIELTLKDLVDEFGSDTKIQILKAEGSEDEIHFEAKMNLSSRKLITEDVIREDIAKMYGNDAKVEFNKIENSVDGVSYDANVTLKNGTVIGHGGMYYTGCRELIVEDLTKEYGTDAKIEVTNIEHTKEGIFYEAKITLNNEDIIGHGGIYYINEIRPVEDTL